MNKRFQIRVLWIAIGILSLFIGSRTAISADFTFAPRISAKTEYNDNVTEKKDATSDVLVSVIPGLSAHYDHSRVLFDLSYDLEHKQYLYKNASNENNNRLNSLLNLELLKDFLYFEATDDFSKKYKDVTRGEASSGDTSTGQTDSNNLKLKPFFGFEIQERTNTEFGASLEDIWYSDKGSVDKRIYNLFWDVHHELNDQWSVSSSTSYTRQKPKDKTVSEGFDRYILALGTTYSYAKDSSIEFKFGPSRTNFRKSSQSSDTQFPWYAEWVHNLGNGWSSEVLTEFKFSEDPESSSTRDEQLYQGQLSKLYDRGKIWAQLAYKVYQSSGDTGTVKKWIPTLGGEHNLTERLDLTYQATVDLQNKPKSTERWFILTSLRYSLSDQATTALSYRFKEYDGSGSDNDYRSNTLGIDVSWSY